MELLIAWGIGAVIMAIFGAWVAAQKNRGASEGFLLGLIFGPLGVVIEALLPTLSSTAKTASARAPGGKTAMSVDELGTVAYIADRYRAYLEEQGLDWDELSRPRKRTVFKPVDQQLRKELKMSPTEFSKYAILARQSDLSSEDEDD